MEESLNFPLISRIFGKFFLFMEKRHFPKKAMAFDSTFQ